MADRHPPRHRRCRAAACRPPVTGAGASGRLKRDPRVAESPAAMKRTAVRRHTRRSEVRAGR
ncbi:hypothetical protein SBRY_11309 [Actinacidiphila bryophytorum]|uniref:Uncharacterized protein n=1 Tax=Actinacidiphila bryophytorum TaxID=1436133 RepID=A0A9W4GZD2_9ACTN|nr:hypothetical protein SBRY_11309 [Actinacidiphila bryophytorum]